MKYCFCCGKGIKIEHVQIANDMHCCGDYRYIKRLYKSPYIEFVCCYCLEFFDLYKKNDKIIIIKIEYDDIKVEFLDKSGWFSCTRFYHKERLERRFRFFYRFNLTI